MNKIAEAKITLTFGDKKIELSMEEAKRLLAELQDLVGTKPIPRINEMPEIPHPWDKYPPRTPERPPYTLFREDQSDRRARFATLCQLANPFHL